MKKVKEYTGLEIALKVLDNNKYNNSKYVSVVDYTQLEKKYKKLLKRLE